MIHLLKFLDYTSSSLLIVVCLLAIFKFPLYRHTALRYFLLVLLITFTAEAAGLYVKKVYGPPNIVIYNIYYLFYFSLLYYIFLKSISEEKFKKFIKVGFAIFWLFYLWDLLAKNITQDSFTIAYIAGAGVLVFCIILYYISILQSSLVLVIKNDLLFWVSVGLFLFYIGYLPIKIIRSWFFQLNDFFESLMIIHFSLLTVMYLFFLTGFLWMKKR